MAKQRKASGPKLVGTVASSTSTLAMLVGDARVIALWRGAGTDDDDGDEERALRALAKRDVAMIDIGTQLGLALSLAVGHGTARIYQLPERVVVVESAASTRDAEYLAWVASAPETKTRSAAILATPSRKLTLVPIRDAATAGVSLAVAAKVAVAIEPAATGTWGAGRRFFITAA